MRSQTNAVSRQQITISLVHPVPESNERRIPTELLRSTTSVLACDGSRTRWTVLHNEHGMFGRAELLDNESVVVFCVVKYCAIIDNHNCPVNSVSTLYASKKCNVELHQACEYPRLATMTAVDQFRCGEVVRARAYRFLKIIQNLHVDITSSKKRQLIAN